MVFYKLLLVLCFFLICTREGSPTQRFNFYHLLHYLSGKSRGNFPGLCNELFSFAACFFFYREYILFCSGKFLQFLFNFCRNSIPTEELLFCQFYVPYQGKKTGHKINRFKLLVGGNFSHLHIKLVTFPRLNFEF